MQFIRIALVSLAFISIIPGSVSAFNERVQFPQNYRETLHYSTVNRGVIREELFISNEAVAAAKANQPLPSGTIIMMEDYRAGALYRYIVMEKQAGWGDASPSGIRNGDWQFREFRPDRTPNPTEDGRRCMSCHLSQAASDFVFTYEQIKNLH